MSGARGGALVLMGSGETAPTMVRTHRRVLAGAGDGPAVLLDTPFGFQVNADDLVERTQQYFAQSVGTPVQVASWRRADAPVVAREQALALLGRASWAFAGPGSPTYALRQWRGTALPAALLDVARRGGAVVVGSAAACTAGTHAVPVYEVYKAGFDAYWEEGLDLLGALTGVRAVVVPHYDNDEGGVYDTRFCYLGESRLRALEDELPDDVGVLGVDEHTALLVDLEARTAEVVGSGVVTLRRRGRSRALPSGTTIGLDEVAAVLSGAQDVDGGAGVVEGVVEGASGAATGAPRAAAEVTGDGTGAAPSGGAAEATSLGAAADAARQRFEAALAARDVDGCVAAVLEVEQALDDWRADTHQNDDRDAARRALRSMVVRLGEVAVVGARDPREPVAPFVDLLLDLRARARADRDFATSDLVRDRLVDAGVEVRDTPDGAEWHLR